MATMITITVRRSSDWLKAQRLETGENIPEKADCLVSPQELSMRSREAILAACYGSYSDVKFGIYYSRDGKLSATSMGWGHADISADFHDHELTAGVIDWAISSALDDIAESVRRSNLADAERAAEAAERAAREAEKQAARDLLADEFARLKGELAQYQEHAKTLGEFLSHVPEDAKRGTLKRLTAAALPEQIDELREKIEAASPVYVFHDDDEDGSED